MTFLPTDYKQPATGGNYLKFKTGTTKFRIMSEAITGYIDWKDNKPIRSEHKQPAIDSTKPPKHFWAFVVWDHDDKRLKVCEITQKSIQDWIMTHYKDEDWGDPKGYDIKVTKEGEKMETKYSLTTGPKTQIDKEIQVKFDHSNINIEALFRGEDPFELYNEDEDLPF